MTPTPAQPRPRQSYRVAVTLTATVDAQDRASAAAEVLHELWLRCGECELLVTMVTEVGWRCEVTA